MLTETWFLFHRLQLTYYSPQVNDNLGISILCLYHLSVLLFIVITYFLSYVRQIIVNGIQFWSLLFSFSSIKGASVTKCYFSNCTNCSKKAYHPYLQFQPSIWQDIGASRINNICIVVLIILKEVRLRDPIQSLYIMSTDCTE